MLLDFVYFWSGSLVEGRSVGIWVYLDAYVYLFLSGVALDKKGEGWHMSIVYRF